jgi:hypothetical protein
MPHTHLQVAKEAIKRLQVRRAAAQSEGEEATAMLDKAILKLLIHIPRAP